MPASFHRITQSLQRDSGLTSTAASLVGVALLASWGVWASKAQVTRYESSDSARLEVNASAYPVQANLAGRLDASQLVLGRRVRTGEILAELDSSIERLSLDEERTRLAAIEPQISALRSQTQSEQAGVADERQVLTVSTAGAMAQYRDAEAQAALADAEAQRAESLRSQGILALAEAERTIVAAKSKRASAESFKLAASRLEPELRVREREREVRLKLIVEEEVKLEAERTTSEATIKRLEYEVERRRIRAPIDGRLGECAILPPGSHIAEGQRLGVILPGGTVKVVAEFSPSAAMGKIHPGQKGSMRLDGFPWAQYGALPARVSRVAGETRDGKIRVELAVASAPGSRIELQHGAPGTVEVEIERTSPAALLLRSAGALVGAQ